MYKGEADWTLIGEVKNNPRIHIPIFGNGDINSPQKALGYKNKYGVDGLMIGRAAIGYPWIFDQIKAYLKDRTILPPPTVAERVEAVRLHLEKSIEWKGEKLGIVEMRRHYTNYFKGIANIKPYRARLVTTMDAQEINDVLEEIALGVNKGNFEIVSVEH